MFEGAGPVSFASARCLSRSLWRCIALGTIVAVESVDAEEAFVSLEAADAVESAVRGG